ncbi:hypothetical protein ACIA8G_15585 [Lentzea sp. NPDC051213]|uniref:hypothetical protein n=1 Tax=Lentzea sp. NPDC051213 TaxID=3364126 RepID=UPI00378C4E0D
MSTALLDTPGWLAIVLCTFGAVITAGLPAPVGLSTLRSAVGLSAVLALVLPSATGVALVMLGVGTAVGVDHSLFRLRRESVKLAKLARRPGAQLRTMDTTRTTTGQSVVVCTAAGVVSMAGLHVAVSQAFTSLSGYSPAVVVAVAVAGSLPAMPTLLAKVRLWFGVPETRRPRQTRTPATWHQPQISLLLSAAAVTTLVLAAIGG